MTKEIQIKTISVSMLQLCLSKTLKQLSASKQILTITHWRNPSHIIIPVECLTQEIKSLLPQELLTQKPLPLAEEITE